MNYNTLMFLVNKDLRAVLGIYDAKEEKGQPIVKRIMFKTLDPDITVGDLVLVPTNTRHKMSVNEIVDVDVDVDIENGGHIPWLIGRSTDRAEYNRLVKWENDAIFRVKRGEKLKAQEALRETLLKDHEFLKALPIVSLNGEAEPVKPPATPPNEPVTPPDEIKF